MHPYTNRTQQTNLLSFSVSMCCHITLKNPPLTHLTLTHGCDRRILSFCCVGAPKTIKELWIWRFQIERWNGPRQSSLAAAVGFHGDGHYTGFWWENMCSQLSCLLKTWSQKTNQRSRCGPTNGHRSRNLPLFQPSLQGSFGTGMKQLSLFRALDSLDTVQCWGIWIGSRENVQVNVQENVFFFVCVWKCWIPSFMPQEIWKIMRRHQIWVSNFQTHWNPQHLACRKRCKSRHSFMRGHAATRQVPPGTGLSLNGIAFIMGWLGSRWEYEESLHAIFNRCYKWCGKLRPRNQGLSNGHVWNKAWRNWFMVYIIVPICPYSNGRCNFPIFRHTHRSHTVA